MTEGSRPNIVVVVLDCVRAQDFPGGPDPVPGMPSVDALIRDGVRFPKAIAPSTWTLPSHASLLTGFEPWEHNLHLRGQLFLNPSLSTIPGLLGPTGYRTLLLSGNGLLSPETGFSSSFQTFATAEWWEPFLRHTSFVPEVVNGGPNGHSAAPQSSTTLRRLLTELLLRYPALIDGFNRVAGRTLDPGDARRGVSPWIEPTFERWLATQPRDAPIFSMFNLIDAHDPYLTEPHSGGGLRTWWHTVSVPQQNVAYLFSQVKPTPERKRVLRALYRDAIRTLDTRIGRIVRILQDAGRWENTLFILTSDHGQALLEKGHLFHGLRVDEQLTRIPLIVRFPGGRSAGAAADGWATLVDIAPLIRGLTGLPSPPQQSGVDLANLVDRPRPTPAVAISDGATASRAAAAWVPRGFVPTLYKVMAAVYSGEWKVVVDQHDEPAKAYNLAADPDEANDRWGDQGPALQAEAALGKRVVQQLLRSNFVQADAGIIRRLEGWGYV